MLLFFAELRIDGQAQALLREPFGDRKVSDVITQ
jgi:hypothetical protein